MGMLYMVSGNNLFGQWLLDAPILKNFEIVTRNPSPGVQVDDFNTKDLKLKHMSWSYNIFLSENKLYVSGAWENNENVVKKLEIFCDDQINASDLLATSNDDFLYVADAKRLKIWIMEFDEISTFRTLDLEFNSHGDVETQKENVEIVKMIASNKSVYFLTSEGDVFSEVPPRQLDTSQCLGKIRDIACGYEHYMLVTDVGHVYTWGSGKRYQLGHGNIDDLESPQVVDALCGIRIIKIAAGGYHCLALSEYGDAYTWGWNDDGQLGVFDNLEQQPSLERTIEYSIPNLVGVYNEQGDLAYQDVVDIACGSKHSALKLEDKTVWTCGYNKYGQLGLSMELFPYAKYYRKAFESSVDFNLMCGIWSTVVEIKSK